MRWRFQAMATVVCGFALVRCGGTVEVVPGGGGGTGGLGRAGGGHAGSAQAGHSAGGTTSVPLDAGFDEYVDPGCPDAAPPTSVRQCDPFSPMPTCPDGEGCYPFVDHPFGAGCGAQSFGTLCAPAGTGRQGDDCGDKASACASGFVCVVGSQPGKHCVQLCPLTGASTCPRGMVCGELDVEGYGVCS